MSTHRKIEYAQLFLGLCGVVLTGRPILEDVAMNICYSNFLLFVLISIVAGLHVVHKLDGRRANRLVLLFALIGLSLSGFLAFTEWEAFGSDRCAYGSLALFAVIIGCALRLRRDFNQKETQQ